MTDGQILNDPPFQFSVTVSSNVKPGLTKLSAMGSSSAQFVLSDPVFIDVERPDSPKSISVDHPELELQIGDRIPVHLYGKYRDGSTLDLSESTQSKYETIPAGVATVGIQGQVTALAAGSTKLVIHHQTHQIVVKVTVARQHM